MTYLQVLERHLGGERYSPHTRRTFLGQARRFLAVVGVKPAYSREDMLRFVDGLIRGGYKADSIGAIVSALRMLFEVNALPWPLTERDLRLGLPQVEPATPVLVAHEVRSLIRAVRNTPGLPRAVVALTTIYGLRGDEVGRVLAAGCDGKVLDVQTAKGGRKRHHTIPSELAPAIHCAKILVSSRKLHGIFEQLMRSHVREPAPREGWHALRRSVVTGLLDAGVEERAVHRWMGWREDKQITYRYYHPTPADLDALVYARHPFLPYWVNP